MERGIGLVPALPRRPEGPLARYRPPELEDAAATFISHFTSSGDLVLDLFCRGAPFLRPAVRQGRRAVGVGVNPIGLLLAGMELQPPAHSHLLSAAFTRLGDRPKGDRPLRRYLTDLYRARCPTCRSEGVAEWFAWDREANYPYAKAVRCPRCEGVQEGPTDEEDIAGARRFDPKGLSYHYALGRVVPLGHAARERAAELVDLYTPRNLTALMDVTIRLEGLEMERAVRTALQGILVETFDRGSGLDPHGEARPRPRTLRLPARFLERNVWFLLEEGLEQTLARLPDRTTPLPRARDLAHLLSDPRPAFILHPSPAQRVDRVLPPGSVALILADPPRPDGVFWALCALWAGWLWDDAAVARAMRPFLRRRRFDWEWHRRALQAALTAAAAVLRSDGHLITLFAEPDRSLVASVCTAAAGAGYDLVGWGADPQAGCHLTWRWAGREVEPVASEPLASDMAQAVERLTRACLEARAEPTDPLLLHTAVYTGLAEGSHLAHAAVVNQMPTEPPPLPPLALVTQAVETGIGQVPLRRDEDTGGVWLPSTEKQAAEPLADRLESRVLEVFLSRPEWTTPALLWEIYASFTGPLTPDLSLAIACVESYGRFADGVWRLREEDKPDRRAEELRTLREELKTLGRRLGFRVGEGKGWDVRWREKRRDVYLFVLSSTAALGRYLLRGRRIPEGAHPCLVFPGGRAELLARKLQRDPRMVRAAAEGGWHFIKFRHLRRLIAEGLDRRLFETMLGLDPIVEREGVQIPLVL